MAADKKQKPVTRERRRLQAALDFSDAMKKIIKDNDLDAVDVMCLYSDNLKRIHHRLASVKFEKGLK
jgi:hypothetical protein